MLDETTMDKALESLADVGLAESRSDDVDLQCRAALQREIDREHSGAPRPRRRRVPLRVAVPLAAVLVGSLGAVGYATLSSPAQLSAGIACHSDGSLDGSSTVVSVNGRPATETCAQLWARGEVAQSADAAPAPLHACVDPNGGKAINVLASSDTGICARAGLREDQNAGADPAARQYGRFSQGLLAKLNSVDCPTDAQLLRMVQDSLDAAGLTAWTINDAGGYSADRPCASLALDSDARVATISPIGK